MPLLGPHIDRRNLALGLSQEYDKLVEIHSRNMPRGYPVGGGDWMDSFFKMEAVRGVLTALKSGKTIDYAFKFGKECSEVAIRLWNQRREWQVHRWDKCCHDYIDGLYRRLVVNA